MRTRVKWGRGLQILKPERVETSLGLLRQQLDHHHGMEPIRGLERTNAGEQLQVGQKTGNRSAAGDINRRFAVQVADDNHHRILAPLGKVGQAGNQRTIGDLRGEGARILHVNKGVLANIDERVILLYNDLPILQLLKTLPIVGVDIGGNGNLRGRNACLVWLLCRIHGLVDLLLEGFGLTFGLHGMCPDSAGFLHQAFKASLDGIRVAYRRVLAHPGDQGFVAAEQEAGPFANPIGNAMRADFRTGKDDAINELHGQAAVVRCSLAGSVDDPVTVPIAAAVSHMGFAQCWRYAGGYSE